MRSCQKGDSGKGECKAKGFRLFTFDDPSAFFVCPCEGLMVKAEGLLAHGGGCGRRRDPFPDLA